MHLTYHPDAETEIVEAAEFYEHRSSGLGTQFLVELDATVDRILEGPERWQLVEGDIRRCLMHRFPYGVYSRATPEEVWILVIKHHSRHPDYWRSRLSE